jgi:hypothetical protein
MEDTRLQGYSVNPFVVMTLEANVNTPQAVVAKFYLQALLLFCKCRFYSAFMNTTIRKM